MPYGSVVSRTLIARSSTPRSPAQRALDPLARLIISREFGHARAPTTAVYLGRSGSRSKPLVT